MKAKIISYKNNMVTLEITAEEKDSVELAVSRQIQTMYMPAKTKEQLSLMISNYLVAFKAGIQTEKTTMPASVEEKDVINTTVYEALQ